MPSGNHLLFASISHFDPKRPSAEQKGWRSGCSSLLTVGQPSPGLPEQPGPGVGDRLVLVDRYDALDDADQRPQEPPSKNWDADEHDAQRNADREVQQSDPEGPDLELVMRPQHRVSMMTPISAEIPVK